MHLDSELQVIQCLSALAPVALFLSDSPTTSSKGRRRRPNGSHFSAIR
jgi:hypothetical protein